MASPFDSPLLLASAESEFVPQYSKLFGRGTPTTSGQASWISNTVSLPHSEVVYSGPFILESYFHTFTFSCWIKRSLLNPNATVTIPEVLFSINQGGNGEGVFVDSINGVIRPKFTIGFQKNNENMQFRAIFYGNQAIVGATETLLYETTLSPNIHSLLDTSSWYHLVFQTSGTPFAPSPVAHARLYINGLDWPFKTGGYAFPATPSQIGGIRMSPGPATIVYGAGRMNNAAATPARTNSPYHGYISEAYFITNQILGPEYFGQLDTKRGAPRWVPKRFTGTYNSVSTSVVPNAVAGTADHYLQFDNVEGSTAWKDSGPNGNNFSQIFATEPFTQVTTAPVNVAKPWTTLAMSQDGRYQLANSQTPEQRLYRSTDFGANWALTGPINTLTYDIVVSGNGQYQFASLTSVTYQLLYSTDFGQTWSSLPTLTLTRFGLLATSFDGQYIAVARRSNPAEAPLKILINNSYGNGSWIEVGPTQRWEKIAMSSNGQFLVAVSDTIWLNSNYGADPWVQATSNGVVLSSGPSGQIFTGCDISNDGRYITVTNPNPTPEQVIISSDYGITWQQINLPGAMVSVRNVLMSQDGQLQMVYSMDSGIYRSTNYGNIWTFVPGTTATTGRNWSELAISGTGDYQTAVVGGGAANGFIFRSNNTVQNLTNDQTVDVPYTVVSNITDTGTGKSVRGNYCTLLGHLQSYLGAANQPLFEQGNLQVLPVGNQGVHWLTSPGTIPLRSGKWYFEANIKAMVATPADRWRIGVLSSSSADSQGIYESSTTTSVLGQNATSWGLRINSSHLQKINNNISTPLPLPLVDTFTTGDVLMCAVDKTNNKVWFGIDGEWCDTFEHWQNIPNSGGSVIAMSNNGQYIGIAGTGASSFIARSDNYGVSFTNVATNQAWGGIAMSYDGSKWAAVVNGGKIWLSIDSGNSWTESSWSGNSTLRQWTGIAMSADGTILTAVTNAGLIWRSTNSGATWASVGGTTNRNYTGVAVSSTGQYQIACVSGGSIYRSVDSGASWTATGTAGLGYQDVAVNADGTKMWAAVYNPAPNGRVYVSTRTGSTWSTFAARGPVEYYRGITVSPDGKMQIAMSNADPNAGGSAQIYISRDDFLTWTSVGPSLGWFKAAISQDNKYVMCVTYGDGGYRKVTTPIDPATGFGETFTLPAATEILPAVSFWRQAATETQGQNVLEVNFGQRTYTYQAPSGYKSICTTNLPEPLYPLPSDVFDARSRTGTMGTAAVKLSSTNNFGVDIEVSKDNSFVYSLQGDGLNIFDISTNKYSIEANGTQTNFLAFNNIFSNLGGPADDTIGVVKAPNKDVLYITNRGKNLIYKVVPSTFCWKVPFTLPGAAIIDIAVSADGRYHLGANKFNRLILSKDGGATWSELTTSPIQSWQAVAISQDGKYMTAVADNNFIYTNDNYGLGTWTPRLNDINRPWYGVAMSADGQYQTAVAITDRIYISSDYGANWTPLGFGFGSNWYSVAMSSDGKYQTAISFSNLYTNSNFGANASWQSGGFFASGIVDVAMSWDGKYQVACGGNTVWVSHNFGSSGSWTGIPFTGIVDFNGIAISADGKNITVVSITPGRVFINDNYGQGLWTNVLGNSTIGFWSVGMSSFGKYQTVATNYDFVQTLYTDVVETSVPLSSNKFNGPYYLDITPDERFLYATNFNNNTVIQVDLSSTVHQNLILVPATTAYNTGNNPSHVKVAPNNTYVAIGNWGDSTLTILDTTTKNTIAVNTQIPGNVIGQTPGDIAITSDSKNIFVLSERSTVPTGFSRITAPDSFSINDTWTTMVTGNNVFVSSDIPLKRITRSSDDTTLYISNNRGYHVVDLKTSTITPSISYANLQQPLNGIKLTSDDSTLFLNTYNTPQVSTYLEIWPVNSIQSLNFTPRIVWTKQRSGTVLRNHHFAYSAPNLTSPNNSRITVMGTDTVAVSSNVFNGSDFNNNNKKYNLRYFQADPGNRTNLLGNSYIDYCWAGEPNVLSITEYTGNNTGLTTSTTPRNISHTLGSIPDWVLIKRRGSNTGWVQWLKGMAANTYLTWGVAKAVTDAAVFQTASWTSTNVVVGGNFSVNLNNIPYTMFAFKEIPGFSSIGLYRIAGTESTWGPVVYTGFAPEFVLIFNTVTASMNWVLFDNLRNPVNTIFTFLLPGLSNNDNTTVTAQIDMLSNGFKIRSIDNSISVANTNFLYIAFAKAPFKYANAGRPFSPVL